MPVRSAAAVRLLLLGIVATSLIAGIAGGLVRTGALPNFDAGPAWLGRSALAHAALMICGFLGTVIGIERAVAVKLRSAFAAPLLSGLGGLALLLGQSAIGQWLILAASVVFVGVNLVIVQRQREPHTLLLLFSAFAWLTGNLFQEAGFNSVAVLAWWFTFLVMTIAAERLEMTRLMRRRPGAKASLIAVLVVMVVGAACSALAPRAGSLLYGAALFLLAAWLGSFDIARRTVRADGLSRYMAVCLLGGYAWLAVAGAAWMALALGQPVRDVALHALGLGFVFSMMMGHAPVILPAIASIKLRFSGLFYVPLAALHLSLILRLGAGLADMPLRTAGAMLNAVAIGLFAATVAAAALSGRARLRR